MLVGVVVDGIHLAEEVLEAMVASMVRVVPLILEEVVVRVAEQLVQEQVGAEVRGDMLNSMLILL